MRLFVFASATLALLILPSCDDRYLLGYAPDGGGAPSDNAETPSANGASNSSAPPVAPDAREAVPTDAGASSTSPATPNGTGAMQPAATAPPAQAACPIAPAPMPVRPLAISTDHVADRLARTLWGIRPDASLLSRTATLTTNADVQDLAREMLANPRAEEPVRNLMRRWLKLDRLPATLPDNPLWSAARRESDHFVTRVVLNEDARLSTLLTAPFTFVDEQALANFYGSALSLPGVSKITIAPEQQRSGILTHVSVLSAYERATRRGIWIRDALLCQEIPPPPSGPRPPVAEPQMTPSTYRQRLVQVTAQPACVACHRLADPVGFALESYDQMGRQRETDEGLPIDDTGRLEPLGLQNEVEFEGAKALGQALAQSCAVSACTVQVFLQQVLGGQLRPSDEPSRQEIAAAFAVSGFNLKELLVAITGSQSFLAP